MIFWSKDAEQRVLECYRGILDSWATPHKEHRLFTSQGETFVLSAGDPTKPPVILLPGSMATSAMWLRTMDVLSSDYHVLAVDIIGDAGYSAPSRPWIMSAAHARWLDDVLDRLSLKSATFVGASFGGLLALDYAVRRHARVDRLALLAPEPRSRSLRGRGSSSPAHAIGALGSSQGTRRRYGILGRRCTRPGEQ